MNPVNDLEINRSIRRVLVKHWIDLGRLSIRSTRGHVMIHGILDRIGGVQDKLSPAVVDAMFEEIQRQHGVSRLQVDLVNWVCNDRAWRPVDRDTTSAPATPVIATTPTVAPGTYVIKTE